MKIKISQLDLELLDGAVAQCEGKLRSGHYEDFELIEGKLHLRYCGALLSHPYSPSTQPGEGFAIIKRERIHLAPVLYNGVEAWQCWKDSPSPVKFIDVDPLVAGMRCYVASRRGDDIDLPDELVGRYLNEAVDASADAPRG